MAVSETFRPTLGRPAALADLLDRRWVWLVVAALSWMVMSATAHPFTIDDMIYVQMAAAMAQEGSLAIAATGGVEGAPALVRNLTHGVDGLVYPQYPSGYGLIAAPAYALAGIRGLMALNAAAALACLVLTRRIAFRLYGDEALALCAVALLAVASFLSTYAVAIWPHALSLALVLAGLERAISGADTDGRRAVRDLLLAGAAFGLAVTLRVDVVVTLAAVWIWIRLFGAPSRRGAALWLLAGAAPGFLLAGWFNAIKFGTWSPISYGYSSGSIGVGGYIVPLAALACVAVAALLIDTSRPPVSKLVRVVGGRRAAAAGLVALAAAAAALPGVRDYLRSVWVLLVDLQQLGEARFVDGVERQENGSLLFWGHAKKALLQSMPWAGLALPAAWAFFRGEASRAHALCLGVIAAPICFYALNEWHGGFSFSMRYFLPASPMLAILGAWTLRKWFSRLDGAARLFAIGAGAGLAGAALVEVFGPGLPALQRPEASYYPTLLLAGALSVAALCGMVWRNRDGLKAAGLWLAGAAVAAALPINAADLKKSEDVRALNAFVDEALSATFPEGALVMTTAERWFHGAGANGVSVMRPAMAGNAASRQAIDAFRAAERCVYLHGAHNRERLEAVLEPGWIVLRAPGFESEAGDFYVHPQDGERCALPG